MSQSVNLSASGPPETVLDPEPDDALQRLDEVSGLDPEQRRPAIAAVVADHPRCLLAWAMLGDVARDDVEAYAAFRVGYHRGLDRLRANGWRGSGYVRWTHPENQGFLRALDGLARMAALDASREPGVPARSRRAGADGRSDRRDRRGRALRAVPRTTRSRRPTDDEMTTDSVRVAGSAAAAGAGRVGSSLRA